MLHADWSPATRAGNVQCVKDWIVPHIGDVRLDRLTLWRIETFYRTLRTEGGRDGGPLSVGSVKRTHSVLHAALGEAVRWRFHHPERSRKPRLRGSSLPIHYRHAAGLVGVVLDRSEPHHQRRQPGRYLKRA